MKATLHQLETGYVLCSDEKISEGELMLNNGTVIKAGNSTLVNIEGIDGSKCLKVLTQSPDLSEMKPEDQKEIGWFDVEKLVMDKYPMQEDNEADNWGKEYKSRDGFREGFQKHKELTSDKIFTQKDLEELVYQMTQYGMWYALNSMHNGEVPRGNVLQKLYSIQQPKSFEVEYKEENGVYKVLRIIK